MSDIERMRVEYAQRGERLAASDKYSLLNRPNLFTIQQRQRDLTHLLKQQGLAPLHDKKILEIGCGDGGVLLEWLTLGATPAHLSGIDILLERAAAAKNRLNNMSVAGANGRALPFRSDAFDIVMQFTAFSSLLDEALQRQVAQEMCRVLKPNGVIIWYDFWLNPTNKQTVGIRPKKIQQFFPNCDLTLRRVTLAPPLSRLLVPGSWTLASLVEKLRLLNTHYLGVIRPKSTNI